MRPSNAETSEPAWVKRKMLSINSSVSAPSTSRKYSATVSPVSLTHARAAEQPDLAAFQKRLYQVNDLDSSLKHLRAGRLLFERRCQAVDGMTLFETNWTKVVHWLANHIHYTA